MNAMLNLIIEASTVCSLTQAVIGPPKLGWTAEHVQAWGMDEWFDFQDHDVRFCSVDYRPPLMRSFLEVGEREF
jgi:hypothetical protein